MPWRLHSFNTRHRRYTNPEVLGLSRHLDPIDREPKVLNPGLRRKFDKGLAFFVSYYEHGRCLWFRKGSPAIRVLPHGGWDTTRLAGVLVWEGSARKAPKTGDARFHSADEFLEDYTIYCNGDSDDDPHTT